MSQSSAVSISKRCTVYILDKISTSLAISVLVFVRTIKHGPGFGAWRCRSFVPALWHVILCQAPVPDASNQFDAQSARTIGARKQPSVLRRPTFSHALKLPVISRRELKRAARPLPPSPPLYPQHQIFPSFSFLAFLFFFPLSLHPLFPRNLR
jgi:hypothetical protein